MVTADHGPAVSGAHNTIVCARAGKDLISCLTSGLLTIVSNLETLSKKCKLFIDHCFFVFFGQNHHISWEGTHYSE